MVIHCAINAMNTVWIDNWIQLLFHTVLVAFIGRWISTALNSVIVPHGVHCIYSTMDKNCAFTRQSIGLNQYINFVIFCVLFFIFCVFYNEDFCVSPLRSVSTKSSLLARFFLIELVKLSTWCDLQFLWFVVHICESAVVNHRAINVMNTVWNDNWIQLSFQTVFIAFIAQWFEFSYCSKQSS